MISGRTQLLPLLGDPTHTVKSPMIYNPWFAHHGIDAVVVPMAVKAPDYAAALLHLLRMGNVRGALVTMPHKISTLELVDAATPVARVAGACNAVIRRADGTTLGDQFDGAGFVRGAQRKGLDFKRTRVLISGAGGVGSAIAASIAQAGAAELMLHDLNPGSADALARRLAAHCPDVRVRTGSRDPAGFDVVVNATPLGMNADDPLPFDVERLPPGAYVGEVVMKSEHTPLLRAALARGCTVQVGTDMLFEMIPAYLEFFGFGAAAAEELRTLAQVRY